MSVISKNISSVSELDELSRSDQTRCSLWLIHLSLSACVSRLCGFINGGFVQACYSCVCMDFD